ncbi:phage portal protein [Natroniella acetigena]|uniref:phage portal protein n=1 Tax=Natroniella acetigena TaxID=52004 RepID=UPI00200B348D|nr:phage portal protein [Natroniella acetigena]MCK8826398.1 phage portal protein [Natroniella acetigena]
MKLIGGQPSSTGIDVNEKNALSNTAVWACVTRLSESIASLPLKTYRKLEPRGKEPAKDHYLYDVLHDQPNPEMTSFTFRECMQGHVLTWGNAYAEIVFDNAGRVKALWPLLPDRTYPVRHPNTGQIEYRTSIPGMGNYKLPAYRVFHMLGYSWNGLKGYSPIAWHRETIGLGMAAKKYGAKFYANDSRPGGLLKTPEVLDDQARKNLKKSWENAQGGLENAHRVAVLEHGLEWQQTGIPPEDAQYIETRKFETEEVARIYNMPLHKIQDLTNATFSNIEEQNIDYVVDTLRPWIVRWEQQMKKDLFLGTETRKNYFPEFLVDGLLRGDIESRYNAYSTARQWGWYSANDIRELENENPIGEKGDIYMFPQNMISAEQALEMPSEEDVPDELQLELERMKMRQAEERSLKHSNTETRSAKDRLQEELKFRPLIADRCQKVVDREVEAVRKAVEEKLGSRDIETWNTWLTDFYEDFQGEIEQELEPVFRTLAESIADMAADEVDLDDPSEEVNDFIADYLDTFSYRYADSSEGQLAAVVRDALEEEEDPVEAVNQRTEEWQERRADKVGMDEATKLGSAVSKTVYVAAGISALRWVNAGDDTCPYCLELDGKVVGIDQSFLPALENVETDKEEWDMKIYNNVGHPPLHQGCQCQLESE